MTLRSNTATIRTVSARSWPSVPGADPNAQICYNATDALTHLKDSVFVITLRTGKLTGAQINRSTTRVFNQGTDIAPRADACACSFAAS